MFGLDELLMCTISGSSGVHKGHCYVPNTSGGWQAFMVVGEAAWVHEGPAFTGGLNGAVVAEEPASTTLRARQNTHYHLTLKGPRVGFARYPCLNPFKSVFECRCGKSSVVVNYIS